MSDIRKYGFIDALRGYAILLVMLTHSAQFIPPVSSRWQAAISLGAHGVQLFYVASAMTLCLSWLQRTGREQSPVRNFFIRRFFRITPMFYAAILVYLYLYGFSPRYWAPNGIHWWFVPLTAFFLHGFNPQTIDSVVPGGWSVAVEMEFYLILPFLLAWLTTLQRAFYWLFFSLALYLLSRSVFHSLYYDTYPEDQRYLVSNFLSLNFFGQLPVFSLGIVTFYLFRRPHLLRSAVMVGNALALVTIAFIVLAFPGQTVRLFSNPLLAGLVCALLSLNLARYRARIFDNAPIRWIGRISFSLYLTHYAVIELLSRSGADALFVQNSYGAWLAHFLCVFILAAPLSYLCHMTIERQGILLGGRLIAALERRDSAGFALRQSGI